MKINLTALVKTIGILVSIKLVIDKIKKRVLISKATKEPEI